MKVKEILKDCSEWMPGRDYDTAKPLVSVLLPTFRRAKSGLFETAVRSVLNQDFRDLELILIDDASTDGTADLIRHFMQIDPRVSCIRHRFNVGLPAISEYEGYMKARGEYIAFIFDDNEWERDYIGKTIPCMIRNHAKAAYGQIKDYYAAEQFLVRGNSESWMINLCFDNYIANGGVVLAREVIESVGLYDPHIALTRMCDWNLWKRISEKYEWLETRIWAGRECGQLQKDSIGNSYKNDRWACLEREQFQEGEKLVPSNFEEIEIDQISSNNSAQFIDAVDVLYAFFQQKEWCNEKRRAPLLKSNCSPLHIMIISNGFSASVSLSFGRLLKQTTDIVFYFGNESTPVYDVAQADAVVLVRNLAILEKYRLICNRLNIPCYLYLDDNFIELAKEYRDDPLIQRESRALKNGRTKSFAAIMTSTKGLKDYYEKGGLNDSLVVLEPCINEGLPWIYNMPLKAEQPITVAYMGGGFRDEMFQNVVIPAVSKIAKQRNIRVLYPSRIDVGPYKEAKNIDFIPIEFNFSLDIAIFRYKKYNPQLLLHCGPEIKNNIYKTENALINAVQIGAVLVASNTMPYKRTAKEKGCCVCVDNTVEDWYTALLGLIEDQDSARKMYCAAKEYCGTRYTSERAVATLKELFQNIVPTPYYEIVCRLRRIMFEQIYGMGDIGAASQRPTRSLTEVPLSFTGGLAASRTYPITCCAPTFSELGICFSSFGKASGTIRIGIFCSEGQLRECVLDMDCYVHDGWTYLEFDPIENAAGQVYMVKLDFEYDPDSALVGVFEDATKRTFCYRLLNKLGFPLKKRDILFADCR